MRAPAGSLLGDAMIHKITFSLKDRESAELLVLVQSAMEDAEKYQPESDYSGIKDSKMALRKLYTGLVNALRRSAVQKDYLQRRGRGDSNPERDQEKAGRTTGATKRKSPKHRSDATDSKRAGRTTGTGRKTAKRTKKA
jgi:hypothetical protein